MPDLMAYELDDIRTMITNLIRGSDGLWFHINDEQLRVFVDRLAAIIDKVEARSIKEGKSRGQQEGTSQA